MENIKFKYASLAIILFITEIIIAIWLTNYHFIRAYFGDFLVVILLFSLAKTINDFESEKLTVVIFMIATFLEIAQYFHVADILNLPNGSIARTLIGTHFSIYDLLMYAAGCITIFMLDTLFFSRKRRISKNYS